MIHTTIGIYRDGSYKTNGVDSEHLQQHIEYNKTYRFGRALVVDGEIVYYGYFNNAKDELKSILANINVKHDKCTAPYH